jgi:CHAD domain-containing protein
MELPSKSSVSQGAQTPLRVVAAGGSPGVGRRLKSVKSQPIAIEKDASLDDAIVDILSSCLDHFFANKPPSGQLAAAEQVHQMRVALRRMRAATGLFLRALRSPELELAAQRAKSIAAKLGAARDLDVFADNLQNGPFAKFRAEPSFYALLDAVECRRQRAYEDVRALLDSAQTATFATELRGALARRGWTDIVEASSAASRAAGSARKFAMNALDRLHKRALKRSEGLASRPEHEQHLARIALKKVRYAGEFFLSLFDDRQASRDYLRIAAKVQDELGAYNDMAVATKLLQDVSASNGANTAYAAGFVRGWLAHAQQTVAAGAAKNQKAVHKLKPFWR